MTKQSEPTRLARVIEELEDIKKSLQENALQYLTDQSQDFENHEKICKIKKALEDLHARLGMNPTSYSLLARKFVRDCDQIIRGG